MSDSGLAFLHLVPAIACALAYGIFFAHKSPTAIKSIVKTMSTAILAFIAWNANGSLLLVGALVFGSLGDLFLSREGTRPFIAGLSSFLMGHVLFAVLFYNSGQGGWFVFEDWWRISIAVILPVLGVFVLKRLWVPTGNLRWPVVFYAMTIVAMGICSLTIPATWPVLLVIIGAFLFIFSDLLLSEQLFMVPSNSAASRRLGLALWFTYWPAQALILAAFVL